MEWFLGRHYTMNQLKLIVLQSVCAFIPGRTAMEPLILAIKYVFVVGAVVEVALILRSLITLAREKARTAAAPMQPAEE